MTISRLTSFTSDNKDLNGVIIQRREIKEISNKIKSRRKQAVRRLREHRIIIIIIIFFQANTAAALPARVSR